MGGFARGRLNSGDVYPVAHFSPHDSCSWGEAFPEPLDPREGGGYSLTRGACSDRLGTPQVYLNSIPNKKRKNNSRTVSYFSNTTDQLLYIKNINN